MEEKQKLDQAFRTYDKLLKFVQVIIDNDITVDILKIAGKEELQKIIILCQMSLGEEIMFKRVVVDLGGNIEPVSIGNNVKPASIITKSLVNMLSINKRRSVSYDSLAQFQNEEKINFNDGSKNEFNNGKTFLTRYTNFNLQK